jgi:hypothetical protein
MFKKTRQIALASLNAQSLGSRVLLCLALCLVLASYWGCPHDACLKYQDIALVGLPLVTDIDSTVMKANDSIIGCGSLDRKVVGSKTHSVKFPINVRIQFFSQGDLQKEIFFEMDKNTVAYVYTGIVCSEPRFIGSSSDDYCWLVEKMGDSSYSSYEEERCIEWSVNDQNDLCSSWLVN